MKPTKSNDWLNTIKDLRDKQIIIFDGKGYIIRRVPKKVNKKVRETV